MRRSRQTGLMCACTLLRAPCPYHSLRRAPHRQWDKAQEARVICASAWAKAGSLSHDKKVALLKEYLVLLFHTVMPPDRVGIVRKLRWNSTLKRDAPGAYRLDMTEARFKVRTRACVLTCVPTTNSHN